MTNSEFPLSAFRFGNRIVAAAAPRMAAANPFRRQNACRSTRRVCTASTAYSEHVGVNRQPPVRRTKKPAPAKSSSDTRGWRKSKYVGADSRVQFFSKLRAAQAPPKNPFPLRQNLRAGDRVPRDQNQFHRLRRIHVGAAGNFRATAAGRGCAATAPPIFLLVTTPSFGAAPSGSCASWR